MRSALLFLALGGCGGGVPHRAADEYTGCGGDEQYRLLDDAEPAAIVDDTRAPQMTAPAPGASAPFSPKVIVKWNQDASDPGKPDGDVAYLDGPGCMACCPEWNIGALTTLHLPPESGNLYDVHFSVDGNYVWRLVTTMQEWRPPDDLWAKWKGKRVSIEIWRMAIITNNPKEGPFVASRPSSFTVGN